MPKIWGRADGSNVVKAMWCVFEPGLAHERIDRGGEFGGNDEPHRTTTSGLLGLRVIRCSVPSTESATAPKYTYKPAGLVESR
jgi:hypothetical protein